MSVATPQDLLNAALAGTLDVDASGVTDDEQATETTNQAEATEPEKQEAAEGEYPEGTPIASKSGGYTIPFEKLAEARTKATTLEAENAQLRAQLDQLNTQQAANLAQAQDQAQARADAGQGQSQADVNLAIAEKAIELGADVADFGDFSEEGIAQGVSKLLTTGLSQTREALKAELMAEMSKELAPLREQREKAATDAYFQPILAAHPDAVELVQSAEFAQWKESLPAFTRKGVEAALNGEGTADVIEVFDAFKAGTGRQTAPKESAAPEVTRRAPYSLSEVAGNQHMDASQQLIQAAENGNANSLMNSMLSMTPEQIDAVVNRIR
jgi:hypothetical protein